MKKYKFLLKNIIKYVLVFFLYFLIIGIFGSSNILNYKIISILNFIFINIFFFICGFKFAKTHKYHGYISGIIISSILIFIMFILCLIVGEIHSNIFIYYFILFISCIIGSIIGVNRKKD